MMDYDQTLLHAKMLFLRTGFCDHIVEFRVTAFPPGTNTVITNCGVCGKEFDRKYVHNPKT